jgi:hypothetical protein
VETLILGLVAGIAATATMTLTEVPSWKRWGLRGVFEWHENQAITAYLVRSTRTSFAGIFSFHFLNGTLAGVAFPYLISFLLPYAPLLALSTLYGIVLWVLTLAPIHKPITGLHPWNHPLGRLPAIASLAGHVVYGITLGAIFLAAGWTQA